MGEDWFLKFNFDDTSQDIAYAPIASGVRTYKQLCFSSFISARAPLNCNDAVMMLGARFVTLIKHLKTRFGLLQCDCAGIYFAMAYPPVFPARRSAAMDMAAHAVWRYCCVSRHRRFEFD